MAASHAARAAPAIAGDGPQNFERLPGAFDNQRNNALSQDVQDGSLGLIDLRRLGLGLNACERALTEFGSPAVLHPLWPALRRLGIRDDRASGRFLDALQIADVNPSGSGRFDFAAETGLKRSTFAAVVFPVFDDLGETIDVAAWDHEGGALALWLGVACLLGEEHICGPRLEHDGLTVHPDALAWLRSGRTGVVVIDPQRALALGRGTDCGPRCRIRPASSRRAAPAHPERLRVDQ